MIRPNRLMLTRACVETIERISPLQAGVLKTAIGDNYEVPVGPKLYAYLLKRRRVDETWSDTILRLVREARHRAQQRRAAGVTVPARPILIAGGQRRPVTQQRGRRAWS